MSQTTDVTKPARTQLRVGRLVKAHGLKGSLKLELYTDDPEGRFAPGASFTLQVPESSPWHGKSLTVREFRWMNSHPVAFFEGVEDRSGAEELVRAMSLIGPRSYVAERLQAFAAAGITTINVTPLAGTPAERVSLVGQAKELAADL